MRGARRFLIHWQNILGLAIVGFFVLVALAAPRLAPPPDPAHFSPFLVVKGLKSQLPVPPSSQTLLGTVATGVGQAQLDVFYTLVWGTRSALIFGLVVTFSTALIGLVVGAVSGYLGGSANAVMMRITDAFLAFPVIAAVVLFQQFIGNLVSMPDELLTANPVINTPSPLMLWIAGINPLMLALILFSWMTYARLTNTIVLRLKQTDFVQAAQALGAGSSRIVFRHLLPNSVSPSIVLAARDVGGMVILEATFTFIGIAGNSAWGGLLTTARRWVIGPGGNVLTFWWVFLPVTLALVFFGIGFSLLGDGLNDWLNPRQT